MQQALQAIVEGEQAGLEALMDQYGRLSYTVAYQILGNSQDAEECVSDVFLNVWTTATRFDPVQCSLKTWLVMLTRRRAVDRLRRRQNALPLDEDVALVCEDAAQDVLRAEQVKELQSALEELGEPDHEIFLRRFFFLESIPSIADRFHMSRQAVDSRLSRGRKRLKQIITGREKDETKRVT